MWNHIGSDMKNRGYHRFRHDYYSLGVVLLQTGLWIPLNRLRICTIQYKSDTSIAKNASFTRRIEESLHDTLNSGLIQRRKLRKPFYAKSEDL
jgi:hypothetical protein